MARFPSRGGDRLDVVFALPTPALDLSRLPSIGQCHTGTTVPTEDVRSDYRLYGESDSHGSSLERSDGLRYRKLDPAMPHLWT
jgi:hypothetical protein